jgi:hypothetical protein
MTETGKTSKRTCSRNDIRIIITWTSGRVACLYSDLVPVFGLLHYDF